VVGFASSAFANDSDLNPNGQVYQPAAQQQVIGSDAYAYTPATRITNVNNVGSAAEQREFDRATAAALSQ
ncbi:MAG: hypothetical protein WC670_11465, partial [Pseudolabrys sp.]